MVEFDDGQIYKNLHHILTGMVHDTLRYYIIDPGKKLSYSITTQNLILINVLDNQKIIIDHQKNGISYTAGETASSTKIF